MTSKGVKAKAKTKAKAQGKAAAKGGKAKRSRQSPASSDVSPKTRTESLLLPVSVNRNVTALGHLPVYMKLCLLSYLDPVEWNALRVSQWTLEDIDAGLAQAFQNPGWMEYKMPSRITQVLFRQCYQEYVRVTPGHAGNSPAAGSIAGFRISHDLRGHSGSQQATVTKRYSAIVVLIELLLLRELFSGAAGNYFVREEGRRAFFKTFVKPCRMT